VLDTHAFCVASSKLLQRRLATAAQQQPSLLGKNYRSHEGIDVSNRIIDLTDVFLAQRGGTVMAQASRIAGVTCL